MTLTANHVSLSACVDSVYTPSVFAALDFKRIIMSLYASVRDLETSNA